MPSTRTLPRFLDVPIVDLQPHPENPRRIVDVDTLAASVKAQGILEPLVIAPTDDANKYVVLGGHRRLAAATAAKIAVVPCHLRADLTDPADQLAVMLSENGERTDLTAAEEATGVQAMLDLGESVSSIAKRTGMSRSRVTQRVKIGKLSPDVLDKVHAHGVTLSDAVFIADHPAYSDRLEDALGTNNWGQVRESVLREVKREEANAKRVKEAHELFGAVEVSPGELRNKATADAGRDVDITYPFGEWDEQIKSARSAVDADESTIVYAVKSWQNIMIAFATPIAETAAAQPDDEPSADQPATEPEPTAEAIAERERAAAEAEAERRAAREALASATDARRRYIRTLTSDQLIAAAEAGRALAAEAMDMVDEGGVWLSYNLAAVKEVSEAFDWDDLDTMHRQWLASAPVAEIGAVGVISTLIFDVDKVLTEEPTEYRLTMNPQRTVDYVAWLRSIGHVLSDAEETIAQEYLNAATVKANLDGGADS
ncbi:ParB/RepB/Spo0J family partition protein [Gordonia malaquae]|uniref:ParB/RepB/Spo0J family partition protein n=1 Tax=Gordonia malaquae TaxID=410332 RepID=UPI003017249B